MNQLIALWNRTPHFIQAGVLVFAGTVTGAVTHYFSDDQSCLSWLCLRHLAASAAHGGLTALIAFYMLPSNKAAILAAVTKAVPDNETPKA